MSNQLDDRIRDLYAELVDAAPPLPPLPLLPAPDSVPAPRTWVLRWPVLAAAATAAIVIVAALPTLLTGGFLGSEDAAETTSVAAAETTAPSETAAPGTTAVGAASTEPLDAACRDFIAYATAEFSPQLLTLDDYWTVWGGVAVFSSTIDAIAGDLFRADLTALNTTLAGGPGEDLSQASVRLSAVAVALEDMTRSLVVFGATDCRSVALAT